MSAHSVSSWRERDKTTAPAVAGASARSPALKHAVLARCSTSQARVCSLGLPHHSLELPVFMPVGTAGAVKGLTVEEMEALDVPLILGNTYHLALRPTTELLDACGGLHEFMGWRRAMLTDSGGFQMVSLLKLAQINEEGVTFQSPSDGTKMLLTPEKSMELQNEIGADIMMALDDVVSSTTPSYERVKEAMHRTLRWIDRCIASHARPSHQNLFGIVQGGLDLDLRAECCEELVKRDLPGYAIGGLSGGEAKDEFWRVVFHCTQRLPANKPRYCMGVGYPVDLVVCVALGVDMFDCVYPARTARFGVALTDHGNMQLKNKKYKSDFAPIEEDCTCISCAKFSRAYLHCLVCKEQTGARLVTIHNIAYMMRLGQRMRAAIQADAFPQFVLNFFQTWYGISRLPRRPPRCADAQRNRVWLHAAGIHTHARTRTHTHARACARTHTLTHAWRHRA